MSNESLPKKRKQNFPSNPQNPVIERNEQSENEKKGRQAWHKEGEECIECAESECEREEVVCCTEYVSTTQNKWETFMPGNVFKTLEMPNKI